MGLKKFLKKVFKPKNLLRIAGGVLLGVPGLMLTEAAIQSSQKNSEPSPSPEPSPSSSAPPEAPTTTTFSVQSGRPPEPSQQAATTFTGPSQSPAAVSPVQVGTSSQPQAMKLQQNVSPYGAAAGVMGAQAAQAAQGQMAPPANQFRAPSMQGIKFGGS